MAVLESAPLALRKPVITAASPSFVPTFFSVIPWKTLFTNGSKFIIRAKATVWKIVPNVKDKYNTPSLNIATALAVSGEMPKKTKICSKRFQLINTSPKIVALKLAAITPPARYNVIRVIMKSTMLINIGIFHNSSRIFWVMMLVKNIFLAGFCVLTFWTTLLT